MKCHNYKMAGNTQPDFNRSALTICQDRVWYTGQRAEKIPSGLLNVVGKECTSLDLSYNELTSISGIKDYANLQELVLDNNNLHHLRTLPYIPTLNTLSLNNNKLSDIDEALNTIRKCCPNVAYVSLLGNPGCPDQLTNSGTTDDDDYERYRLYAIHVLPSTLKFLDSRRVSVQEKNDALSRGRFLRTVKLKSKMIMDDLVLPHQFDDVYFHVNYTPLPRALRSPQDHKGAYGKCKYRYSGKNSEGNRFISNNDL
ncbi:leucine-rich melanocyte differentiation-associated protein-like [Prorops nasuta]|uniref:leucine-rich melanocyte differentiation-associated protein-like n=1 Tax=Prorops nasuta TaxID=863751 RepID=UPI0034CE8ED1